MSRKNKSSKVQLAVFMCVLFSGMVISLLIPLRPSVSATEKRELNKFPKFSFSSFFEGSFFDGIDAWFSDTFPFREGITTLNTKLNSWYGFGNRVTSLGDGAGDEIPDAPTRPPQTEKPSDVTENTSETQKPSEKPNDSGGEPKPTQSLGGVLVAGNAAYEYYNFSKSTADRYISAVNRVADKLSGKTSVYDMIIPTSIDITLDSATRRSVSSSDQRKAMDYMYGSLSNNVKKVDIYNTMKERKNEYIYFRTDHHWTALGAYYAYCELMKEAGKASASLDSFEKVSYGEFLGSFYADTNKNKKLKKHSDELIAYRPKYDTVLTYTDKNGTKHPWPLIMDAKNYSVSSKYLAFAAGDQPYISVISSAPDAKGSCIAVKESFGNALVPFLTASYKKVYVIDYRYWNGKLSEFAERMNIDDIFYINNISATRNYIIMDGLVKISE